ncbi:hypothetical protein D6855_12510 [Butyrivibrio sp. CB08]|uniref:hypothetical protein n=1 Tax=Butyrivibrio sp. CB08 TaxID=2364879 RepID=UPI000EA8EA5A|nr:hypothetical protein [Butyrivibrio sp. CB08]RKM57866.1 hypothetical protein D6855_12510 [Butyrivibrio sp. CB08]
MVMGFLLLLYFIRICLIGITLGTAFIKLKLFHNNSDVQVMAIGMASTPLFISFFDYALGLVFIGWPSAFFFLVPILVALVFLLLKKNYLITADVCSVIRGEIVNSFKHLRRWILFDAVIIVSVVSYFVFKYYEISAKGLLLIIFYSMNTIGKFFVVALVFALVCTVAYFIHRMIIEGTVEKNAVILALGIMICTANVHALIMLERPGIDSDGAHYELEARYFLEDKNSWEVDNYKDDKYGSSMVDDHGPLWVLYLADVEMAIDTFGEMDSVCGVNFAIFWAFICFNIFVFILSLYGNGTYRTGLMSLVLFHIYVYTALMVLGSRDAFRFVGLIFLTMIVLNQIDSISLGKCRWSDYFFLFLGCYLCMNGHAGNAYIMLGMFLAVGLILIVHKTPIKYLFSTGVAVLVGTLFGITKTIKIYLSTGRLKSWTLIPFHDTPVIDQVAEVNRNRADIAIIWDTYSYPVRIMMLIGVIGYIVILISAIKKKNKSDIYLMLLIGGMLLPMTGLMNWIGWDVSLWFAEQLRYRMYFLMLFAVTGARIITKKWKTWKGNGIAAFACLICFMLFIRAEVTRFDLYNQSYVEVCKNIRLEYEKIANIVDTVTDGDAYTHDQLLLLYLHGSPKLLYHPCVEELIQAKTDSEIENAIDNLNVGAIIIPADGIDYHDYSLLPFWDYINDNANFKKITPQDGGYSLDKVIYYRTR